MATYNVAVGDQEVNLLVGYQDENEVSQVVFDFSAWNTAYGAGTIALSVQRSQDEWPYAVTMTVAGTNATWEISETDTAFKGTGYAQLTYTVSDVIKKSAIYRFTVYESLGANGSVVTPIQIKALFTDVEQLKLDVGTMSNLTTTEQGSLVGAINEVDGHADTNATNIATNTSAIGTLANLTTTAKGNLVAAINEVDGHADTNATNITNLMQDLDSTITELSVEDSDYIHHWHSGWVRTDGSVGDASNICRTMFFHLPSVGGYVRFVVKDGYKIQVNEYGSSTSPTNDSGADFIGRANEYTSGTFVLHLRSPYYCIITIMKNDESRFSVSDLPTDALTYYWMDATDVTLTQTGKSADALVVGQNIDAIEQNIDTIESTKQVTIHFENGKYDDTEHRYGGPVSNWPNFILNKYPIIVDGAETVIFPVIEHSNTTKYNVYFRDSNGASVYDITPTASIGDNHVSVPSGAYYMDVMVAWTEPYDITVKIVGGGNNIGEAKRIYINGSNEMVNYFEVDADKGLYTAMTIMLPPNYSHDGEKVPLVIWFDGNTNYPTPGSRFSSAKMPGLTYVRDEGFAVAQIFAWGTRMNALYSGCGSDMPYPTPTCLKNIKVGVEYICDRFNVDPDEVHIMSKSMGGLISLYFVSHPVYPFKSIGMFSPILDLFGLRGRYPAARRAIFEDMAFNGDVEEFADIDSDGNTSTGVPNYYFSPRCVENTWANNLPQLIQLNPVWTDLIGDTFTNNYAKALDDARAWYEDIYATGIYNHPEYKKIGCVPFKIWGAMDDDNVPYQTMPEIVEQYRNAGLFAEIETKTTGGHSLFDVGLTYAQDITTQLGILHEDVPIGWIENVAWIRQNSIKYDTE